MASRARRHSSLTFSTSTVVIFIILLVFMFKVMASNSIPVLGSPGALWDLLQSNNIKTQALGARNGSYLTMQSGEGLILATVILVSGFSSVFVDPSYGQKAIAGEPGAVVKGYFFGAFAWFSIPLGLCATMSYVAIALSGTEYWPVAGGITTYQINNALILPLAAQAVMGKGGAAAVILMVFMAVTSSFSAEIIAHASIVTFDIYQPCKFNSIYQIWTLVDPNNRHQSHSLRLSTQTHLTHFPLLLRHLLRLLRHSTKLLRYIHGLDARVRRRRPRFRRHPNHIRSKFRPCITIMDDHIRSHRHHLCHGSLAGYHEGHVRFPHASNDFRELAHACWVYRWPFCSVDFVGCHVAIA